MSDKNLVISIDAMGGDNSPKVVIEGLFLAHKRNPNIRFFVYGDKPKVEAEMAKYPDLKEACEIFHTDDFVHNDDKPSHVIRNRSTSMYQAIEAVKLGKAQAVVSAGNTGALMAISKMVLKTIQKIHRPAIITVMPHENGRYVMLDLGANTECDGINLAEFAIMGNIYAKCALNIKKPRVALMNIGAEEMKGKNEIHVAAHIIKSTHLNLNFIGYIEPHEIPQGKADVIVADGFSGNIALKSVEGTSHLIMHMIKNSIKSSFLAKLGLAFMMPAVRKLKATLDPRLYNGAMLVGLNGLSVKSHGGIDAFGFSVAVENAANLVATGFVDSIHQELEHIDLDEISQEAYYEVY